jgi:hypothetical protein
MLLVWVCFPSSLVLQSGKAMQVQSRYVKFQRGVQRQMPMALEAVYWRRSTGCWLKPCAFPWSMFLFWIWVGVIYFRRYFQFRQLKFFCLPIKLSCSCRSSSTKLGSWDTDTIWLSRWIKERHKSCSLGTAQKTLSLWVHLSLATSNLISRGTLAARALAEWKSNAAAPCKSIP